MPVKAGFTRVETSVDEDTAQSLRTIADAADASLMDVQRAALRH
jgi:hypothetical protein